MAMLEPVHVLEQDRATAKMECTKINPTRSWAFRGEGGYVMFTYQNGKWFGTSGMEMDAALVPEECKQAVKDYPVTVETRGPAVVKVCEFCGEQMNRSEMDEHLVKHVREALAATGTVPKESKTPPRAA
jgi:hypothetical protein